jgi:cobalt-zinc-cadmium efflux system protein
MVHDHGASGHSHNHTAEANAKMLGWALALTSVYLVAEVIGGFVFNSLVLLADAAHMMTDVAALVIALLAIKLGQKPADDRRTFGYRRFEILAAAFNAVLLFGIAVYVLVEAVQRFSDPEPIQSWGMLIVAVIGLLVNLVSMRLLTAGKNASFNVKGAYLEVWADMIGSVGVIAGALVIRFTGWTWVDPIVAVGIGLWVLPRTWVLLRDTTNVLLEGVPGGLKLGEVRTVVAGVSGVAGLHDLHVWSMSNDDVSATLHVTLAKGADPDAVRRSVSDLLTDRFDIEHSTMQTEGAGETCADRQGDAMAVCTCRLRKEGRSGEPDGVGLGMRLAPRPASPSFTPCSMIQNCSAGLRSPAAASRALRTKACDNSVGATPDARWQLWHLSPYRPAPERTRAGCTKSASAAIPRTCGTIE